MSLYIPVNSSATSKSEFPNDYKDGLVSNPMFSTFVCAWSYANPSQFVEYPMIFRTSERITETQLSETRGKIKNENHQLLGVQNQMTKTPSVLTSKMNLQDKPDQKIKQKKNLFQNPKRNILTNIGNQLITFISTKHKSQKTLMKLYPQWSAQELTRYYSFARQVKQQTSYYLNVDKLRKMWKNKSDTPFAAKWRSALRRLSFYHLISILPISITSSRKMKGQSKLFHLKARRIMIHQLRNPNRRFSF